MSNNWSQEVSKVGRGPPLNRMVVFLAYENIKHEDIKLIFVGEM